MDQKAVESEEYISPKPSRTFPDYVNDLSKKEEPFERVKGLLCECVFLTSQKLCSVLLDYIAKFFFFET